MAARKKDAAEVRGERFELRLTEAERADCEWALAEDGALSLATWMRFLAAARVRYLRRRAQAATTKTTK